VEKGFEKIILQFTTDFETTYPIQLPAFAFVLAQV